MTHLTHPLTEQIAAMLRAGATYRAIRAELGVGQATIAKTRAALGIPTPPGRTRRRKGAADADARIAAMLRAGATYRAIRAELGVCGQRITRVRVSERIPLPDARPGRRPYGVRTPEQTLAHYSQPTPDGHTHWTGPTDGTKPKLWHGPNALNPLRVAFRLHHGREPQGHVRPGANGCDDPACITGAHLTDRTIREANQRADKAFERIFGT
jgi:uncharacterized protein YerC